ncbi:MAG: chorismate mutase [Chloroflexi bacterium]|nr:chorismate mutase [Chloroflexota bacterium]
MRGIRGATTVDRNERGAILEATRELLEHMVQANDILPEDVATAWFTTTPDLNADFPAIAARRELGWTHVALMDAHHMDVPGALPMCLRIMLLVNTTRRQDEIAHIYLRGARVLRPDLPGEGRRA